MDNKSNNSDENEELDPRIQVWTNTTYTRAHYTNHITLGESLTICTRIKLAWVFCMQPFIIIHKRLFYRY